MMQTWRAAGYLVRRAWLSGVTASLLTGVLLAHCRGDESVVIHHDPSREIVFPANHTSSNWRWGDTFLVAYAVARPGTGADRLDQATREVHLARTTDGGRTWTHWDPEGFIGDCDEGDLKPLPPRGIDLACRDLAIACDSDFDFERPRRVRGFWVSYDRGSTWSGPHPFAGLTLPHPWSDSMLTARTDYQVSDDRTITFFMSAKCGIRQWQNQDAAFVVESVDRGRTFRLKSWVAADVPAHSERFACPSSARLSQDHWVVALRRRRRGEEPERNWIDLYRSRDRGSRWAFAGKVTATNPGNGNPPALIRLRDGVLACAYGRRHGGASINIRYSADDGATWSPDFQIRGGASSPQDLGYCRLYERTDGRLVVVYYWTSPERPQRHLCATLFPRHAFEATTASTCRPRAITTVRPVSSRMEYELGRAVPGARPYTDRAYVIESLPAYLQGREMVRTANDDDGVDGREHLHLTLSRRARIYLAYQGDALPSWAVGWARKEGDVVRVSGAGEFALFTKLVEPGRVTLGGNCRGETGAASPSPAADQPGRHSHFGGTKAGVGCRCTRRRSTYTPRRGHSGRVQLRQPRWARCALVGANGRSEGTAAGWPDGKRGGGRRGMPAGDQRWRHQPTVVERSAAEIARHAHRICALRAWRQRVCPHCAPSAATECPHAQSHLK